MLFRLGETLTTSNLRGARPSQAEPRLTLLKKKLVFRAGETLHFSKACRFACAKHLLKKRQHQSLASPSILNLGGQEKNASRADKIRVLGVLGFGLAALLDKMSFRARQMTPFPQSDCFVRAKPLLLKD